MKRIISIEWDTDGEPADLPTAVSVPDEIDSEDIADYLSDAYGFCVFSYRQDGAS